MFCKFFEKRTALRGHFESHNLGASKGQSARGAVERIEEQTHIRKQRQLYALEELAGRFRISAFVLPFLW